MRHLLLSSAVAALIAGAAGAEIINDPTDPGLLTQAEYIPDEGGTFTAISQSGEVSEWTYASGQPFGPIPDPLSSPPVGTSGGNTTLVAAGGTTSDGTTGSSGTGGGVFAGSQLLYSLPTFIGLTPSALLVEGPDGTTPTSTAEVPGPSPVPLPATGLLLAVAGGALMIGRRRK